MHDNLDDNTHESDCVSDLKVEDINKKGSEKATMEIDTESVEINKRNIQLFDQVFSTDEEVQVCTLLFFCTGFSDKLILTFCIRPKL